MSKAATEAGAVNDLEANVAEGPPEPGATGPGLFKSQRARGHVRQEDPALSPPAPPRGPGEVTPRPCETPSNVPPHPLGDSLFLLWAFSAWSLPSFCHLVA